MEKKSETVRRSKIVKFVRAQKEAYDMIATAGKPIPEYMEGVDYIITKMCKEFKIEPEELKK